MQNDKYILRSDAIKAFEDAVPDVIDFLAENMGYSYPNVEKIVGSIPAADVVPVVRCKDCKYKPTAPEGITAGYQVDFPDELNNPCPCNCEDGWYSEKPSDNFFCAYGARMDKEADDV